MITDCLYSEKSECTGCGACVDMCPNQCITIHKDNEHFLYPHVEQDNCIDCQRCLSVCPNHNNQLHQPQQVLVGTHTKQEIKKSASGGAFWALCQTLIPQGYAIVGVRWQKDFKVTHDIAFTLDEALGFRKSKYIPSNTKGIYKRVTELLQKNGQKVLFTGLPCQVAACRNIVGDNDNLILVDLICHGVPNQDAFDEEIKYLKEKQKGTAIESFSFKQKEPIGGVYNNRSAEYYIGGKKYIIDQKDDPFLKAYYSRLFYRPSCSKCKFSQPMRTSDITLADAWGVEKVYSDFNPFLGVSMIFFNTKKGLDLKDDLCKLMDLRPVSLEWAISANEQLRKPTETHKNRDLFFQRFDTMPFSTNVKDCTRIPLLLKITKKISRIIRDHLPNRL